MLAREAAVTTIAGESFDVLVIGGGITGAGVALDAASRGYSVALVEQGDFARGTSSRSSKLVHGGLRYLQSLDLGLVREALRERELLASLAPHLVRPLPLVVPAFDGARPDRLLGLGLNMYDAMAVDRIARSPLARRRPRNQGADRSPARRGGRDQGADWSPARRGGRDQGADWSPARHRIVSGAEVLELVPALAGRAPTSGYLFFDCQTDDARLVLTVLAEAERFGAVAANRVQALGLTSTGARVRDVEAGAELDVRAANVVNATGVWADRLRAEERHDEAGMPVIRPSRGAHLVLPAAKLPVVGGAIASAPDGRTVFVLPWLGQTLVGTTDVDHEGGFEHVPPSAADVEHLLGAVNSFFAVDLGRGDIAGAYAGVRPLIGTGDSRRSVDISRRAELYESSGGVITITGGKLTTWRRMAKLAVDRIVARDGRDAPCRTHEIPLGLAATGAELPRVEGVPEDAYEQLAGRYGHAAHDVLALAAERAELAEPVLPGFPDLLAEAAHAVRREQARGVGDVLLRRTRLGLTAARRLCVPGERAPERVAAVLGSELGWGAARQADEADAFRDEARAEGLVVDG